MRKIKLTKKLVIYSSLGLIAIIILISSFGGEENISLTAKVERTQFIDEIVSSGELMASSSEKIMGPGEGMRTIGIWSVNITDLIDEGSKVDSGDYIATLDRDQVGTKYKENEIEVQKALSQYTQTELDTSLKMRESRNELINLKFAMDEAKIVVEESKYEPPATIRKNEIAYEKAELKYEQAKEDYKIKKKQFEAKMQESQANLNKVLDKQTQINDIMQQFIVNAPKSGILIYSRSWDGKKNIVGSRVNAWNAIVAELPNLNFMKSRTYVNEVDIRKVKKGQKVEIGLDGFPGKKLYGEVDYVATVGEQMDKQGTMVFEVTIGISKSDSTLLPGMTTSNRINIETIDSSLIIPVECLIKEDSIEYVMVKDFYNSEKRVVKTGSSNMSHIIILEGLEEGEEVFYNQPESKENTKK